MEMCYNCAARTADGAGGRFPNEQAPLSGYKDQITSSKPPSPIFQNPKEGSEGGRRVEMRFVYDMGKYREWCEVESAIIIPPHGLRQAFKPSRVRDETSCLRHEGIYIPLWD